MSDRETPITARQLLRMLAEDHVRLDEPLYLVGYAGGELVTCVVTDLEVRADRQWLDYIRSDRD